MAPPMLPFTQMRRRAATAGDHSATAVGTGMASLEVMMSMGARRTEARHRPLQGETIACFGYIPCQANQ
jgi:hypothetical protein